jgi:hypothetical protein
MLLKRVMKQQERALALQLPLSFDASIVHGSTGRATASKRTATFLVHQDLFSCLQRCAKARCGVQSLLPAPVRATATVANLIVVAFKLQECNVSRVG